MTAPVVLMPGIIAPAALRYGPLLAHLPGVDARPKDLEVYRDDAVPAGYSMATEVDGLRAFADRGGIGRFHLYGHSGGGAVALAFAAAHPDRLLSLVLDEPATDFTAETNAEMGWPAFDAALAMPEAASMAAFQRLQVAPDVELAPPPPGPPPPWFARRPAGIRAFLGAIRSHHLTYDDYGACEMPVLLTRGSLSHPRWVGLQGRLAAAFPEATSVVFDGVHHLHTSHQAEPARVAELLTNLWARAELEGTELA